jgi:4-amino-4-deoxy-L-arabinose transferase-like glycosyltransferase
MINFVFKNSRNFWEKYELIIPLVLFALSLAFTLPGISWGAPDIWHPDEVVLRTIKALNGEWKFSEINFDYPDLPQYTMFWLGRLVLALGNTENEVLIASRVLSAFLAGLTVVLAYIITRRAGGSPPIAGLSGLLLLGVSELAHNGRFAHNDIYITFFVSLAILCLINYSRSNQRGWLYVSFLVVGMAASSKYNGISLVIAPALVYLISQRQVLFNEPLRTLETIFISGVVTFLGYSIGTPKAFFWMTYYFKRMIPALIRTGNYGHQPDSARGITNQYMSFANGAGMLLFTLFAAAFIWACYRAFMEYRLYKTGTRPQSNFIPLFLLSIFALDLPIMISYNYPPRFFLPMMPIFAILSAFFVGDMYALAKRKGNPAYPKLIGAVLTFVIAISFARNISVMLLFMNDARIPAGKFIKTLPAGTSLEHTYYPPTIPEGHFDREHNYPIYFVKSEGEALPTNKRYLFNAGEEGLDDRLTDYLLIDSFTWEKFDNQYTCKTMQVECDFFKQLAAGESAHYKLIADFSYQLPPFVPQLEVAFVNPEIRFYERIP